MASAERVIAAARKVVAAQRRARELKDGIDWSRCERTNQYDRVDETEVEARLIAPCPFDEEPRHEWCDPCRENARMQQEWRTERARRTGFLRTLENAVRALDKAEEEGR